MRFIWCIICKCNTFGYNLHPFWGLKWTNLAFYLFFLSYIRTGSWESHSPNFFNSKNHPFFTPPQIYYNFSLIQTADLLVLLPFFWFCYRSTPRYNATAILKAKNGKISHFLCLFKSCLRRYIFCGSWTFSMRVFHQNDLKSLIVISWTAFSKLLKVLVCRPPLKLTLYK